MSRVIKTAEGHGRGDIKVTMDDGSTLTVGRVDRYADLDVVYYDEKDLDHNCFPTKKIDKSIGQEIREIAILAGEDFLEQKRKELDAYDRSTAYINAMSDMGDSECN